MKKIILASAMILLAVTIFAQLKFEQKNFAFNAAFSLPGDNRPKMAMGLDYRLFRDISASGEFTFLTSTPYSGIGHNYTNFGFLMGANYHFNSLLKLSPRWDLYAGPIIEYQRNRYQSNQYIDRGNANWEWGFRVGARYYIYKKIALHLKIGSGNIYSIGTAGFSIGL